MTCYRFGFRANIGLSIMTTERLKTSRRRIHGKDSNNSERNDLIFPSDFE
jgi:hypothetical protein